MSWKQCDWLTRRHAVVGFNPIDVEEQVRTTRQLSITLPTDMAEAIRAKVAAGEYPTESEVIRDGLRVLMARDRAVEAWLRAQVAPAYDALKADPSSAARVKQVRARLASEPRPAQDLPLPQLTSRGHIRGAACAGS